MVTVHQWHPAPKLNKWKPFWKSADGEVIDRVVQPEGSEPHEVDYPAAAVFGVGKMDAEKRSIDDGLWKQLRGDVDIDVHKEGGKAPTHDVKGDIIVKPTGAFPLHSISGLHEEASAEAHQLITLSSHAEEEGESSHAAAISAEEAAVVMSSIRQCAAEDAQAANEERRRRVRQQKTTRRSNPPPGKRFCAGYCQFCPETAFSPGKSTCDIHLDTCRVRNAARRQDSTPRVKPLTPLQVAEATIEELRQQVHTLQAEAYARDTELLTLQSTLRNVRSTRRHDKKDAHTLVMPVFSAAVGSQGACADLDHTDDATITDCEAATIMAAIQNSGAGATVTEASHTKSAELMSSWVVQTSESNAELVSTNGKLVTEIGGLTRQLMAAHSQIRVLQNSESDEVSSLKRQLSAANSHIRMLQDTESEEISRLGRQLMAANTQVRVLQGSDLAGQLGRSVEHCGLLKNQVLRLQSVIERNISENKRRPATSSTHAMPVFSVQDSEAAASPKVKSRRSKRNGDWRPPRLMLESNSGCTGRHEHGIHKLIVDRAAIGILRFTKSPTCMTCLQLELWVSHQAAAVGRVITLFTRRSLRTAVTTWKDSMGSPEANPLHSSHWGGWRHLTPELAGNNANLTVLSCSDGSSTMSAASSPAFVVQSDTQGRDHPRTPIGGAVFGTPQHGSPDTKRWTQSEMLCLMMWRDLGITVPKIFAMNTQSCLRFMRRVGQHIYSGRSDQQIVAQAEHAMRVQGPFGGPNHDPVPASMFVDDNAMLLGDLIHQNPAQYSEEPEPPGAWCMPTICLPTVPSTGVGNDDDSSVECISSDEAVFNAQELDYMDTHVNHQWFFNTLWYTRRGWALSRAVNNWAVEMLSSAVRIRYGCNGAVSGCLLWWRYESSRISVYTIKRWWGTVLRSAAALGHPGVIQKLERLAQKRSRLNVYSEPQPYTRRRVSATLSMMLHSGYAWCGNVFRSTAQEEKWVMNMLVKYHLRICSDSTTAPVITPQDRSCVNHDTLLHFLMAQERFCRKPPSGADTKANLRRISEELNDMPAILPENIGTGRNACQAMQEIIRRYELYDRSRTRLTKATWVPADPVPEEKCTLVRRGTSLAKSKHAAPRGPPQPNRYPRTFRDKEKRSGRCCSRCRVTWLRSRWQAMLRYILYIRWSRWTTKLWNMFAMLGLGTTVLIVVMSAVWMWLRFHGLTVRPAITLQLLFQQIIENAQQVARRN